MKRSFTVVSLLILIPMMAFAQNQWVDLSHSYNDDTLYWPTAEEFELHSVHHGNTQQGYFYSANNYSAAEHGGTHVDAPIHFSKQGKAVEQIPLEQLMGNAIIVDVRKKTEKNHDYLITVEDFTNWEKEHGKIPDNTIILLWTGYEAYWPNAEKYLGTNKRGNEAIAHLHFPGLSGDGAKWLVKQRHIKAVGIDTASIDYGQSKNFIAHRVLAVDNIPIFENVTGLGKFPSNKLTVIALPMKIKGGSGAPLRIIGRSR